MSPIKRVSIILCTIRMKKKNQLNDDMPSLIRPKDLTGIKMEGKERCMVWKYSSVFHEKSKVVQTGYLCKEKIQVGRGGAASRHFCYHLC